MTTVNNLSPFSKILVGVDSSENSYRAFEYALRLSKMSRAKVYLLHVIEISSAPGSFVGISDLEKSFEEEAQKLLDSIVARVDEQNYVFRIENIRK
jgi:nucleotide-binding universal stress UspA family protein